MRPFGKSQPTLSQVEVAGLGQERGSEYLSAMASCARFICEVVLK